MLLLQILQRQSSTHNTVRSITPCTEKLTNQSHQKPQDLHLVMASFYMHLHHFLSCSSNIPTICSLHSISSSYSLFSSDFIFHRFSFSSPTSTLIRHSDSLLTHILFRSHSSNSLPLIRSSFSLSFSFLLSSFPAYSSSLWNSLSLLSSCLFLLLPKLHLPPFLPSHHHSLNSSTLPPPQSYQWPLVGFAANARGFWRQLFGVGCNGNCCEGLQLQGMMMAKSTDRRWERLWL